MGHMTHDMVQNCMENLMDFFLIFLYFFSRKSASKVRKYKKVKNMQNGPYDTSYSPELDGESDGYHCNLRRCAKIPLLASH